MVQRRFVHSVWHEGDVPVSTGPLEGEISADVVVIGGGIAGLSCAYFLRRAGADVVLLERGAVGAQSSTRNYGELATVWNFGDAPIAKRRQWARFAQSAIPALAAVLEEEGIDCGLRPSRSWLLARTPAHVKQARADVRELQALGYEAGFAEPDQIKVTAAPTLGARWETQARLDPYKLVQGLKRAILRQGVRVFENTEVIELRDGAAAQAVTPLGHVTARKAVIAMNAFSTGFGVTDSYALPVQIFSLATRPLPEKVADAIGPRDGESLLDLGDPATERRFFQRFLPDGRLLFGGGLGVVPTRADLFNPRITPDVSSVITHELVRRYPVLEPDDIQLWWGGAICRPVGERPIIGSIPGTESLLISLVCNGKGVAVGSSAGRLVTELVTPGSSSDADLLAFLDYCKPRQDVLSTLEGALFNVLRKGPARTALNMLLNKPERL